LRRSADQGFEVFVTGDRNIQFQQNLSQARLGVVVLAAKSNRMADLLPLIDAAREAIFRIQPGQVERITA
jgi:hypothetical protein